MRPEDTFTSNQYEMSNRFEKSFRLHGNFNESNLEISNHFQIFFFFYLEISIRQLSKLL